MLQRKVEIISDPQTAVSFLNKDRLYSTYALGILETEHWACCTALLAHFEGETEAFFLLAQPREAASTLFVMGDPVALEEIFQHPLAAVGFVWISGKDEHMECLRKYWQIKNPEKMLRMVVSRETFVLPKKQPDVDLRRLGPGDNSALVEAYETAFGSPTAARLMAKGPYYGVWSQGRLASVAGTHVVCPRLGLAAAGNVWTRPTHRGRGLGTLTVGAVTQELLESCEEVVLNVREDNIQARKLYERLGYRTYCHYWQMQGGAPQRRRRSRLKEWRN